MADLADDLERLVGLHGADTIAAVIVEPVAGSTGVLLPPKGYLQRLREISNKHGIVLIFDEVITGFGRLGAPFAVDYFGVVPDIVCSAKALTNGAIPMGAVFASRKIYDGLMRGDDNQIELFHGYTYSGHPVACAAGIANLDIFQEEKLFTRAATIAGLWQQAIDQLRDCPHVQDIRTIGLIAGIELASRPGRPGSRSYDVFVDCFEKGLLIRVSGDIVALSPPLIIEPSQIEDIVAVLGDALRRVA
jgi:beta-alanine--pyruvate transaminase